MLVLELEEGLNDRDDYDYEYERGVTWRGGRLLEVQSLCRSKRFIDDRRSHFHFLRYFG